MWKGRFSQDTSSLVQQFGESISYDWRLFPHDIAGSIAHARAQKNIGLLTADEFSQIENGLKEILADIEAGKFEFKTSLEDIHMNIESELTRRIGAAGAKLHTARSRNDQVATDTRLYARTEIDGLLAAITGLQNALLDRAEKYAATVIPGYTHLQRGQPVTAGHHFLAYVEMLERDKSRLTDARKRLNISPLGSGALAGLSDAHTTGSSLMPQKKNPDVCELTRGKTGRLVGNLMNLLVAVKGLPLTYNRDLQEDKPPLFDSVDTLNLILAVNTEMISAMELREENCKAAASDPMLLATDLADYLVKKGVPFRHAHELVGKAVAQAIATKTPLDQLDLPAIDPAYGPDAKDVFSLETALAARTNPGAPSIANVAAEIVRWKSLLGR